MYADGRELLVFRTFSQSVSVSKNYPACHCDVAAVGDEGALRMRHRNDKFGLFDSLKTDGIFEIPSVFLAHVEL